jgi:hypothetical protein
MNMERSVAPGSPFGVEQKITKGTKDGGQKLSVSFVVVCSMNRMGRVVAEWGRLVLRIRDFITLRPVA